MKKQRYSNSNLENIYNVSRWNIIFYPPQTTPGYSEKQAR